MIEDGDYQGAAVGTNLKYARIHEYGGKTRPHVILPRYASVLSFVIDGKRRFARKVKHPGSVIPARSYLRSSLEELRPKINEEYENAVSRALK